MKFHDNLNPKIWDAQREKHIGGKTTYHLKREVKNKLDEIAEAFIEYLDIPEDAIEDIRLVGSSANYNYTDFSDIDIHVIVDYNKVHEDCPLVTGYLWALKTLFNNEHDITIYGIPVELYAEDSKLPGISNGVYSLLENKWLSIPEKIEVTVDDNAVIRKSEEFEELIDKVDTSEKASELLLKIYKMRKAGLQENGEYSTENLAFKNLRNKGLIDKLWGLKKQGIDKELSLNESQPKGKESDIKVVDLTDLFDEDPTMEEVKSVVNELFNEKAVIPTATPGWSITIDTRKYAKNHIIYPKNFSNRLPNGKLNPNRYRRNRKILHNKAVIKLQQLIENSIYWDRSKVNSDVIDKKEKQNIAEYVYFRVNVKIDDTLYYFQLDTEIYKNDKLTNPMIVHMYNIEDYRKPNKFK